MTSTQRPTEAAGTNRIGFDYLAGPTIINRSLHSIDGHQLEKSTFRTDGTMPTAGERVEPTQRIRCLMPPVTPALDNFTLLEKWDGIVVAVQDDVFTARLYNLTPPNRVIQAAFSNTELGQEERCQIEEGASFVWTIGYRNVGTTRHRESVLYFRRLESWNAADLESAKQRAIKARRIIGW